MIPLPPIPKPLLVVFVVALIAFGGAYAYVASTRIDCKDDAQACLTSTLTVVSTTIDGETNGPIESTTFNYTDRTIASFAAGTLSFNAPQPLRATDGGPNQQEGPDPAPCKHWPPGHPNLRVTALGLEPDGTYRPDSQISFKLTHNGAPVDRGTIKWGLRNADSFATRGTLTTNPQGIVIIQVSTLSDGQWVHGMGFDPYTCTWATSRSYNIRTPTAEPDTTTSEPVPPDDTPATPNALNLPLAVAGHVHADGTTGAATVGLHAWLNTSSGPLQMRTASVTADARTGAFDALGIMFEEVSQSRLREGATIAVVVIVTARAANGQDISEVHHFVVGKRLNDDRTISVSLYPADVQNHGLGASGEVVVQAGTRVPRRA